MRALTISLIIGIVIGAAYLYVVPILVWLAIVVVLLCGSIWISNRKIATVILCVTTSIVGIIRISQNMDSLEQELRNGSSVTAITKKAEKVREKLKKGMIDAGLEGEALGVSVAMTLGDKSLIDKAMKDAYSRSGASHVLAMSGMHLSIVYALLVGLIMWLPRRLAALPLLYLETHKCSRKRAKRIARIGRRMPDGITIKRVLMVFVILTIWAYTIIAGMAPSLTRAATMLTIASITFIMLRKTHLLDSVTLAAFIMLLISPISLYDVGFQMSFLATLGIGIYYRPIHALLPTKWGRFTLSKVIWSGIVLSVAAQILIVPIVAYYFHRISCYGLLTSLVVSITALLIVWTGVFLLIMSALSAVPLVPFLSSLTAQLLTLEVKVQNSFLDWVVALPYSTIEDVSISLPQLLLIYIIIGAVTQICHLKGWLTCQESLKQRR